MTSKWPGSLCATWKIIYGISSKRHKIIPVENLIFMSKKSGRFRFHYRGVSFFWKNEIESDISFYSIFDFFYHQNTVCRLVGMKSAPVPSTFRKNGKKSVTKMQRRNRFL